MTSDHSSSTADMNSDGSKSVDLQPYRQEEDADSSHNSSSHRSIPSNTSRANSVKEVAFVDMGSKGVRYGSRKGSSGAERFSMSMSQREISDEDSRLVYVNDPAKN